tara:strand:+ start:780 stop:2702 length:1923 start_codon:yes stop_codon:yes gene_type:complete
MNYGGGAGSSLDPQEEIARESANPLEEPLLSIDWVKSTLNAKRTEFQEFFENCEEAEDFYLSNFDFDVPETGSQVRLGTAHSTINTLVAHVTPQFLDISVPPPGPKGQARAELLEKFLRGANHMLEQFSPTRRETAKHMALYGIAFEKTEFAANRWDDFPEPPQDGDDQSYREQLQEVLDRRNINWPITSTCINPKMMVWDTNNLQEPRWVMHFYEIDASWVKAHFPSWEGADEGTVEFVETWTHSQVCYMADGKFALEPKRHGYKTLPFTMYWPHTGLMTDGNEPSTLYRGILSGNFEMLRAESRLASQYLDIVGNAAWPTRDFRGPPGITEQVMEQYEETPGAKNFLPQNVQITQSETPDPPSSIVVAQQMMQNAIEDNTAPAVSRGQRPKGAASGYHTAVLAGIAALNFGAYIEAAQRGLQDRNSIMLHIIENVIQDKVTVFGKTETGPLDAILRPNDIRGHYMNIVQLTPTSPEEQERKLNLYNNLWRTGFIDQDSALRKAGVSNALEVRSKLLAEQFLKSQQVQQVLQGEAARRIPLLQQLVEATGGATGSEAQQIAQNILNTQGQTQLPNAGNFSTVNQPPRSPATEAARVETNTRPVVPGSLREQELVGRQIASPRTGNRRVPTTDLAPGLGR